MTVTNKIIQRLAQARSASLIVTIIIFGLILTLKYGQSFANFSNLAAVMLGLSLVGILTVGMTMLLVGGSFDLSVGSSVAMSGVMAAYFVKTMGLPIIIGVLGGIGVGAMGGLLNGLIIVKMGVNPMITTLATMGIYRGAAILIAGAGIPFMPKSFTMLGQSVFLGFQIPVWVMLIVVLIMSFCMSKIRFFRQYYFMGGNEKAAFLSGININKLKIVGYTLIGALAGIAGVLQVARLGTAMSTIGNGAELQAITAALIGGASLSGGRGTILGAILGAIFMAMVSNVMIIAGISVYWQSIVIGCILIIAVYSDVVIKNFVTASNLTQ